MLDFRTQLEAYLLQEATPPHKYGHQPRLYTLTEQIAERTQPTPAYDDEVVFAATYLHDLGVFLGHRPQSPASLAQWDHVAYICDAAPTLLKKFGFPAEKISTVLDCIGEHQPHDTPQTFEAALLRDADILERLGAIGILRTASKLGSDTRFHMFTDVRNTLQSALDTLPAQIRLEASRELAIPRIQAMREFLPALDSEAGEHLH